MKEIVIMAGTKNPEKRFLSFIKALFPECAIRIICPGSDREKTRNRVQASDKEMRKNVWLLN